jgi:hypothetical protein
MRCEERGAGGGAGPARAHKGQSSMPGHVLLVGSPIKSRMRRSVSASSLPGIFPWGRGMEGLEGADVKRGRAARRKLPTGAEGEDGGRGRTPSAEVARCAEPSPTSREPRPRAGKRRGLRAAAAAAGAHGRGAGPRARGRFLRPSPPPTVALPLYHPPSPRTREQRLAGQQLREYAAHRPNVDLGVVVLRAQQQLGGPARRRRRRGGFAAAGWGRGRAYGSWLGFFVFIHAARPGPAAPRKPKRRPPPPRGAGAAPIAQRP